MKNIEVINAFIYGRKGKTKNLKTDGSTLINYTTPIAVNKNGVVYVTNQRYSQTTTRIVNELKRTIGRYEEASEKELEGMMIVTNI